MFVSLSVCIRVELVDVRVIAVTYWVDVRLHQLEPAKK